MEFNVSSTSFDRRVDISEQIFANMKARNQSIGKSGILLTGDPGVGKTSFIRFFSTLVGIEQITIEAPHITEEHIINIPFIVFNPVSKKEKSGSTDFDTSDFKVVLSDSHLYSQIKGVQKIPDAQYLESIYRAPQDVIKVFEELGGSKDKIPEDIQEVRDSFKCILFLDEYFRQTSPKIRNMLRGILNNKIGSHDIPHDVFIIYATNLSDGDAVEDIPLNNDFHEIEFNAPDKDEWFSWLVAKFEKDTKVKLNPKVINKFYEILEEDDLNHTVDADVRTSPRRWEQLLLYINSSLPAENPKEAKSLLTNVKANFKDYLTGKKSELLEKVTKAVAELIKETSDIDIGADEENDAEDWQQTLEHQIRQKMKLGEHRKYIPIISGLPGIGKTTHAQKIAKDLDLRYIYIDCSNLNPEDVVGLPLPKGNNKEKMETQFSEPTLYHQLLKDVEEADKDHLEFLKHKYKGAEAKKAIEEYESKDWKYLIFFDELNRNSTKVFNGIRRILLEKSFGGGYDLPEGSVVMAAINPFDKGATDLTSHMKDVVDVIDSKGDFTKTQKFLQNMPFSSLSDEKVKDTVYDVLMKFVEKFRVKHATNEIGQRQRSYYLDVGSSPLYISPREYSDLFSNAVIDFDQKLKRLRRGASGAEDEGEKLAEMERKLRTSLFNSFKNKLNSIMTKQDGKNPVFMHDLEQWFLSSDEIDFGEGLYYKKAAVVNIEEILKNFFDNPQDNAHLADDMDFVNFIENTDPHKFQEQLSNFLVGQFEKDEDVKDKLIDRKHKAKSVKDEQIAFEEKEVSKFEHLIREMINAIVIHRLANDRREMIFVAVRTALKHIQKAHGADYINDLLEFNMGIYNVIRGIEE